MNEIDLIIGSGTRQIPVEIKSSGTFSPQFTSNLKLWQKLTKKSKQNSFIIYTGNQSLTTNNLQLLNWSNLTPLLKLIT